MSWIRLDDQIAHHPKLVRAGLSSWMWCCCIAYAQKYLTDGFIPADAISSVAGGVTKPKVHAAKLVKIGLLDKVEGGYQVHDYLDFNEPAQQVREKRRIESESKARAGRIGGLRSGESRRGEAERQAERQAETKLAADGRMKPHPIPSDPISNSLQQAREKDPGSSNGNASLSPAAPKFSDAGKDPFTDSEITTRAGAFVERYQELYPKHRKGARYSVRPVRDYAAAVTLCQTWPDERLDKLAVCFLTTDHKFAEEGSRTLPQFLALASWCDGKLSEWEQGRK